jgi:hypothetical protein
LLQKMVAKPDDAVGAGATSSAVQSHLYAPVVSCAWLR